MLEMKKNSGQIFSTKSRTGQHIMSAIVTTKKEVNEACLDFMLIEVVDTVVRTSDPSAETVNFKLERMGFRVGQKLGER
jgi:ribosomal protein S11